MKSSDRFNLGFSDTDDPHITFHKADGTQYTKEEWEARRKAWREEQAIKEKNARDGEEEMRRKHIEWMQQELMRKPVDKR